MELYTFTLVKGTCHVPMGQGTLDFGLAMYRNTGTLHEQRNTQVDVDVHLHEELRPTHMAAVSIWLGHDAFLAEPLTPTASRKALCLCCKEWRNV